MMKENVKRYFWLKLKEDFFDEKYIKALRKLPQGDSLAIVYLKMQLKSLKTEGIINYEGIMPDAISELSLMIDEDEHVVRLTVEALIRFGVVERWDNESLYLVALQQLIGSESQGAERVRKHRELKKIREIEASGGTEALPETLHCNTDVTECNGDVLPSNTEIEKEIEIEIDIEKSKSKKEKKSSYGTFNNVRLTLAELESLENEFPETYSEAIDFLSEYIETSGRKYKSHYLAMRKWVFNALKEQQLKKKEIELREERINRTNSKPSAYSKGVMSQMEKIYNGIDENGGNDDESLF